MISKISANVMAWLVIGVVTAILGVILGFSPIGWASYTTVGCFVVTAICAILGFYTWYVETHPTK